MNIRRLTASDYNKFFPLINEFRQTNFTENEFKYAFIDMNHHTHQIWVLEENDTFIACGTIIFEQKFIYDCSLLAHIEDVIVKESERRKGYGKLIVKHLLQIAKKFKKCYKVTLDCNDSNVPFYLSCGLEKRGNQMCQIVENI